MTIHKNCCYLLPYSYFSIILICIAAVSIPAQFSGGSGTVDDPFKIANFNDLYALSQDSAFWSMHFIQTADINAGATRLRTNLFTIGTDDTWFTGTYNGQNHVIDSFSLHLSAGFHLGLFGKLSNARVDNIGMTNAIVTGWGKIGCLAGAAYSSVVTNCHVTGSVDGAFVGGLVGETSQSELHNCWAQVEVSGTMHCGGLVGYLNYESKIVNCYATGNVNGGHNIGGLVGKNSQSSISGSYAYGNVTSLRNGGGLIGFDSINCIVENCYSTGKVTGEMNVGGLVAKHIDSSSITNCYATGMVQAFDSPGALVAISINSDVHDSYWNVQTSGCDSSFYGTGVTTAAMMRKNTFDRWNFEDVWAIDEQECMPILANICNVPVIIALPADTLQHVAREYRGYVVAYGMDNHSLEYSLKNAPNGMTISSEGSIKWSGTDTGTYDITVHVTDGNGTQSGRTFRMVINNAEGSGTAEDPYQIDAIDDLRMVSDNTFLWDDHFLQVNDIDASDTKNWYNKSGFNPIGRFTGTYDGNGHVIDGLYIHRGNVNDYSAAGMFALTVGAVIENVGLTGCYIDGHYKAGALAAVATKGTVVRNCYSKGSVSGNTEIGGLVGSLTSSDIIKCYSSTVVSGVKYVGGLVGYCAGFNRVDTCFSYGIVNGLSGSAASGENCAGGLIGANNFAKVHFCYSTANVDAKYQAIGGLIGKTYRCTVSRCFADGNVKGGSYTGGLTGKVISADIEECFFTGSVRSFTNTGGLVGSSEDTVHIHNCYTMGSVSSDATIGGLLANSSKNTIIRCCYSASHLDSARGAVSGLVSANISGMPESSFYDREVTGIMKIDGLYVPDAALGKTTGEMKTKTTYTENTDFPWNFNSIWKMHPDTNSGYPFLQWQRSITVKTVQDKKIKSIAANNSSRIISVCQHNHSIFIDCYLNSTGSVSATTFTLDGRMIASLESVILSAGRQQLHFYHKPQVAGTCLCRLTVNGELFTKKLTFIQ